MKAYLEPESKVIAFDISRDIMTTSDGNADGGDDGE